MLKKSLIFLCCCAFFSLTTAQTIKSAKVYLNFSVSDQVFNLQGVNGPISNQFNSIGLGGFSPALHVQHASGKYHEWELSNLQVGNNRVEFIETDSTGAQVLTTGRSTTNFGASVRYEFGWNLGKPIQEGKKGGLVYGLGIGVQPYFTYGVSNPLVTNEFRATSLSVGARLQAVPRIMVVGKKRLFIDLNFPITFMSIGFTNNTFADPTLPEFSDPNLSFLPFVLQARLGVGVKLN